MSISLAGLVLLEEVAKSENVFVDSYNIPTPVVDLSLWEKNE